VPVLIGWSAVTNSLGWAPVVLFAIIFIWTPPHFWALAIKYKDDYGRANVPMLPVVESFRTVTNRIVGYTVALLASTLVFAPVADMGPFYIASAVVLGSAFLALTIQLRRTESPKVAMRVFTFSISYITLLFGAMAADQLIRSGI
jgi:protoheme IX farnesyltransferase